MDYRRRGLSHYGGWRDPDARRRRREFSWLARFQGHRAHRDRHENVYLVSQLRNSMAHEPTNGWSENKRYVNTTLDDLKYDVMRIEEKVDKMAIDFAYNKGRVRTVTGLISAAVAGVVTLAGIWIERLILQ